MTVFHVLVIFTRVLFIQLNAVKGSSNNYMDQILQNFDLPHGLSTDPSASLLVQMSVELLNVPYVTPHEDFFDTIILDAALNLDYKIKRYELVLKICTS